MFLNDFFKIATLLSLTVFSSCKGIREASIPERVKIPGAFIPGSSKEAIADLPIRAFFTDSILIGLIDTAIQNNPDLRMAMQRIEIARANLLQSKGAYLPFISADGSAGVVRFGEYTVDGVGNFDTNLSNNISDDQTIPNPTPDYFLGLRSSWEVDIWGRLRNKKRAAYSRFLASEKGKHLIITSLVANVSELYYTLLILDQELLIIRNNIELQEKAVETIQFLKEGGRTNELAVRQANAQLLNTKALEFEILLEITAIENNLNFLLGRFPQPARRSKELDLRFFPQKIAAGIPSDMLLRRPDIQQAELELRASEYELKSARAAFLPSLTITGFGGYNAFNAALLTNPGSLAYSIFSGLSAPVLQGKRIKANYRSAVAYNYESYYAYQKAIYNGFREVHTNLVRIENYRKIVELKEQQVEALHMAVISSSDLFRSGYASYLEVIMTQRNVLDAEIGLINAKKQQYMSLVELYRSLGGGWE